MKKLLPFFGLLLISGSFYAQTKKECHNLLNKEISEKDISEDLDAFVLNLKTLIACEFDAIDYQIFMGPKGNMPMVAQSMILQGDTAENNKKYTFKDLRDLLITLKSKPQYTEVRQIVAAQNAIINKEASIDNWKVDKQLLIEMGLSNTQLNAVLAIVQENETKNVF